MLKEQSPQSERMEVFRSASAHSYRRKSNFASKIGIEGNLELLKYNFGSKIDSDSDPIMLL